VAGRGNVPGLAGGIKNNGLKDMHPSGRLDILKSLPPGKDMLLRRI